MRVVSEVLKPFWELIHEVREGQVAGCGEFKGVGF
jgi:hypothetical protein